MILSRYLRGLFADDTATAARAPAPATHGSQMPAELASFGERLNRMLWERRAILSGNIHLVGLSRIRERVGDEWPRIAERAQDIAQKAIQRVCGPGDVFTRYDDFSYLIIFANLTREQAQLRCVEIAEDIGRRLLGDNFLTEATEVRTGVFETDGTLVFNAVDKHDLVSKLVEHTKVDKTTDQNGAEPDVDSAPAAAFQLDKTQALGALKILYQPMWHPRQRAIAGYFTTAATENVFGKQLRDDAVRSEFCGILSPAEFDLHVTRTAIQSVTKHMYHGTCILAGWPVHFETLATRASREAYIKLCREIPETIRKLLIFELIGQPDGVPASRIVDVVGVLRSFCRSVMVRVPADFRRFDVFQGANIGGVGISLLGSQMPDGQAIAQISRFAENALRTRQGIYVHGLNSRPQILAAVAAGYDWIGGPAVRSPGEQLGNMYRYDLGNIYRPLQAA